MRLATSDDIPAIIELGRTMHIESTFAPMDYDPERMKATLTELIAQSQYVVVATDDVGQVIGGLVGMCTQSWFGSDMVANDLALFVHPDWRKSLAAEQLVLMFVHWAKLAGAKQIRPGVTSGDMRAEKLYERMGFSRCGASFVMEGV
jgi:GNAT superfamily N-acetyltransferase